MHRALPRRLWALAAVLCIAGLITGCTGGAAQNPTQSTSTSQPRPPALEKAWQLRTGADVGRAQLAAWTWRSDNVLTVLAETSITGHEAKTGRTLWSLHLPKGLNRICAVSEQTNADGIGGLLLAGKGKDCSVAAAIDTSTGKLLWKQSMGNQDSRLGDFSVSVGEETLTTSVSCDEVRRFDLSSGKPLHTYVPRDEACANDSAHNGQLIAVLSDPETKDTPDDHGTGFVAPHEGTATFKLYDADTGTMRWSRQVDRRGAALNGIVHVDPLVLDTTVRGHRLMRFYGRNGEPGPILGKALSTLGDGSGVLGAADNVLVVSYDSSGSTVSGYDLATGKELWARGVARNVHTLGIQRGGLLQTVLVRSSDAQRPSLWLTRRDLRDPQQVTVLGRIPVIGSQKIAWDKHRLYVYQHNQLRAYKLPANGADMTRRPPPARDQLAWQGGDMRENDVSEACEAIQPQTLKLMGFHSSHLPATIGCSWEETHEPEYVTRRLNVSVDAVPPDEGSTATAHAREVAGDLRDRMADEIGDRFDHTTWVPVSGLGDRAWLLTASLPDGTYTRSALVARYGNVTVQVGATMKVDLGYLLDQTTPRHLVERGVVQAAAKILDGLGANFSPREPAPDGRFTRAQAVCALLDEKVPDLTPDGDPVNLTPASGSGHRQTGCLWSSGDTGPTLTVSVYAVPGSAAEHASASQVAQSMFGHAEGLPVHALGDEAVLDTFTFEDGDSITDTLTVRKDNLLVSVEYERWEHPAPKQLHADVKRVVRAVLAGQHP